MMEDHYMRDALNAESARIARHLTWDEAMQTLSAFLTERGQVPDDFYIYDWISCTGGLPVSAFYVEGAPAVAWGHHANEEGANLAVQRYQANTGTTFPYTIVFRE